MRMRRLLEGCKKINSIQLDILYNEDNYDSAPAKKRDLWTINTFLFYIIFKCVLLFLTVIFVILK